MLILNEKEYAKNLYEGKNNQIKSVVAKVGYVTRYLLYGCGLDDENNYLKTIEWMNEYHDNFDESCYSKLISDAVKKAHKKPFFNIENITITKYELGIIESLNNLRAEKVLFVLLCMAKQQREIYGLTNGLVKYSLPDLCKMARISVPTSEREYILYEIVQHGFLGYPKKNDTSCLMVTFIDDDGDAEFIVDEIGCQELAYTYLNWKNKGKGYGKCEFCKRLMKKTKNDSNRFCKQCSEIAEIKNTPDGMKPVECKGCNKIIYVSKFDTETCMCDECYTAYRREYKAEKEKERRARLKECVDSASKT